jgi:hypothetical protein
MIDVSPMPAEAVGQMVARREGLTRGGRWLLWKGGSQGSAEITVVTRSDVKRTSKLSLSHVSDNGSISLSGVLTDNKSFTGDLISQEFFINFQSTTQYQASGLTVPVKDVPEVRLVDYRLGHKPPLHQLYTKIVEQGRFEEAKSLIRDLVPSLEDIRILTEGDLPILHFLFRDYSVPAVLAGDGIQLLLQISFELATRPGGIVLLEEPEIHMHPGAIRQCARAILAAMRRQIQIVLTTHSLDLIDALLAESLDEDLKQLSLYNVLLRDGKLISSRLTGPEVAFSRAEIEDDLR